MRRRRWHRVLAAILSVAMVLAATPLPKPTVAYAREEAEAQGTSWPDNIDELLSAAPYAEGEVIAGMVATGDEAALQAQAELPEVSVESLLQLDAQNVLAREEETEQASDALVAQAEADGEVSVVLLTSDTMSTEEMLRSLATNDRVAFAEPNYLMDRADETDDDAAVDDAAAQDVVEEAADLDVTAEEQTTDEAVAEDALAAMSAGVDDGAAEVTPISVSEDAARQTELTAQATSYWDLTPQQWSNSNDTNLIEFRSTNLGSAAPHSVNVPNFGKTGSNMDRPVTVAVFDGMIDHTNPDLANVVYEFSAEQQKNLGCGQWAFNAAAAGGQTEDVFVTDSHGTHCAGILGASWDGAGISGAASNVKIISIQMDSAQDSRLLLSSMLRGYAFIDRFNNACTSDEQKVRVTSTSITYVSTSRALDAAVYEAGQKQKVVSVFAAGNDALNADLRLSAAGSLRQNPYALVVASTDMAGNLSPFSNFGINTVTLAAPGTGILSTVDAKSAAYLPDATGDNLVFKGFDSDQVTQEMYDNGDYGIYVRQVPMEGAIQAGTGGFDIVRGNNPRFAGSGALSRKIDRSMATVNEDKGTMSVKIRVIIGLSEQDITRFNNEVNADIMHYVGFSYASEGKNVGYSEAYVVKSGVDPSEYPNMSAARDDASSTGGWGVFAAAMPGDYVDVNQETGNGQLVFDVVLSVASNAETIALDSFGIGTNEAPYAMMDGTSMATPLVAGCTAVYTAHHPDEDAAKIAARVRASVTSLDSLSGMVSTGGMVDLANDVAGTVEDIEPVKADFPLYEETLALDVATNDPYVMDAPGDFEAYGPMVELDGKLWYFPGYMVQRMGDTTVSGIDHENILAFDLATQTWDEDNATRLPDEKLLPGGVNALANFSVCAYQGKLWMFGGETGSVGADPVIPVNAKPRLLSYEPSTGKWEEHATKGLEDWTCMVLYADSEGLKILDCGHSEGEAARDSAIYTYDAKTGLGTKVADFPNMVYYPQVACRQDKVYVFDEEDGAFYQVAGSTITRLDVKLPDPLIQYQSDAKKAVRDLAVANASDYGVLVASTRALYLVGYTDKANTADTWVIPYDTHELKAYGKHIASTKTLQTAAAFANGKVYSIAASWGEQNSRVFRATQAEEITQVMYRLYNPNSGEHFYTADMHERDDVVAAGWRDEGIGWVAPVDGDPVYRMYNRRGGEHHYTLDSGERDMLIRAGWNYEGIGWYSDPYKTVAVLREYNPNQFSCNHNFTVSKEEHDHLVKVGWRDEGIAWYAVAAKPA